MCKVPGRVVGSEDTPHTTAQGPRCCGLAGSLALSGPHFPQLQNRMPSEGHSSPLKALGGQEIWRKVIGGGAKGDAQLGCQSGRWGRWEMGIAARPNTREDLPVPLPGSHAHGSDKAPALGLRPGEV